MDNVEEFKKVLQLMTMNQLVEINELILREMAARNGIEL